MPNNAHSPADDLVFDLVSVQYHALKAATAYAKYAQDAEGHDDIKAFFQQCQEQDAQRAETCHAMLGQITSENGLSAS